MEYPSDDEASTRQAMFQEWHDATGPVGLADEPPTGEEELHPYAEEKQLTARGHVPPEPVNVDDRYSDVFDNSRSILDVWSQPLPGYLEPRTLEFQIEWALQSGLGYRAQVFIVRLCGENASLRYSEMGLPCGTQLVAKIFDPILMTDLDMGPFDAADKFYTHEAYVYNSLRNSSLADAIPQYHGGYTLYFRTSYPDCPVREVRMILLEYVDGIPMAQFYPREFSLDMRKSIIATLLQLEGEMSQAGVNMLDFGTHNILIVGPVSSPSIVLIDFADASVETQELEHLHISPAQRWARRVPEEFFGWVDWDWASFLEEFFGEAL